MSLLLTDFIFFRRFQTDLSWKLPRRLEICWRRKRKVGRILKLYFVLLMKSHLQSYPCPLQINFFWNFGFLLGVAIILQIITGIFLALHYTSDLNSAYFSLFFLIREVFYGWCLRYFHSSGASFVFLFHFEISANEPDVCFLIFGFIFILQIYYLLFHL